MSPELFVPTRVGKNVFVYTKTHLAYKEKSGLYNPIFYFLL